MAAVEETKAGKMPALQLLYFQYEILLEEQNHRKKLTKLAKNAGASEKAREKQSFFACEKVCNSLKIRDH